MTPQVQTLNETLQARYGAMMTAEMLAAALHRPTEPFRQWLNKSSEPSAVAMRKARKKIGRRIYFVTIEVAGIIAGEGASE